MAAGKEARRKDRLAAAGGKKKEEDLATIPTPAMLEVKGRSKPNNGVESEVGDVMDNPTPAMMAIMQKRQVHTYFKPTLVVTISEPIVEHYW